MNPEHPLILFDGVCNLCDHAVQFILQRDDAAYFYFASLQSEVGQQYLEKFDLKTDTFDTFILIEKDKWYSKSTAALRVVKKLKGAWPLLWVFMIVPPFIRDAVYSLIARNRYKLFGKKDTCMLPTPEVASRFLG